MSFAERLQAVRAEMLRLDLAAFLVPRSDEHLGEYVPPSAERLAWLSGFTGSAGIAAVLPDRAVIWSDGRYVLQLADQTMPPFGNACTSPKSRRQHGSLPISAVARAWATIRG